MKLERQLLADSGYDWVMARTETASPLGHALLRTPVWYGPEAGEALLEERSRVAGLLRLLEEGSRLPDTITHILYEFRDIRGSLRRPSGIPMDEVELFEIKHFLLRVEELWEACGELPAPLREELTPMREELDLLDPGGRRLPAFSMENTFSPELEEIRRKKAEVEQVLRTAKGENREPLLARRRELVIREDRAELEARKRLTTALLRKKERFNQASESVGRLDLALAKARLARRFGCCRPEVSEVRVEAQEMIHPEVAAHLAERDGEFVPVSLTLERGTTVITGANMGGKSVTVRSLTLNLLLAQTGFYVFARAFSAPLFDSMALICADGQSPERGLSSFGAEVAALDGVLRREREKFFFVALDEFARGTNPREGAALARALAEYLDSRNCVAVMTTHYDGVSDAAGRHYRVAGLSGLESAEPEKGEHPLERLSRLMDYSLIEVRPGEPCPRDALRVCRLLNLDPELTALFSEKGGEQNNS